MENETKSSKEYAKVQNALKNIQNEHQARLTSTIDLSKGTSEYQITNWIDEASDELNEFAELLKSAPPYLVRMLYKHIGVGDTKTIWSSMISLDNKKTRTSGTLTCNCVVSTSQFFKDCMTALRACN